jgi:hypothetical protein
VLAALEAIHLLVESLDAYFGNVCELDIIYHQQKALFMVDEMFAAGELMEPSKRVVSAYMEHLDAQE